MGKRILSAALCALVLLSCLSIPQARGMEDAGIAEAAYITVNLSGYERRVQVFTWEEDLLFSAGDLAELSGFVLKITPEQVSFTRGSKEIRVERSTGKLTCPLVRGSKILKSPVLELGGQIYLSGAELLPWLNVGMKFEGGTLYMVPNPVSLWDFAGEINLKDYGFSTEKCTQIMGISSTKLDAIIYMDRHYSSVVFLPMPDRKDFASKQQYYELLDDFFLDQTASDLAVTYISEGVEVTAEFLKSVGMLLDVLLPGIGQALETVGEIGKGVMRYMTYCSVFDTDNTMQLAMMRSIYSCRDYNYNDNLVEAVGAIIDTYTDFWKGMLYQTGYDLVNAEVAHMESLSGIDLYRAFKLTWTDDSVDNTKLKRFSCYRTLSGTGMQVYLKGWGSGNHTDIQNYICHAMLYLYASEQCYRGVIQYMIDNSYNEGYDLDMVRQMKNVAAENDKLYAKFLSAALYISYDLVSFKSHSADYEKLVQSFANLELQRESYGIARTAEMAVYMAALLDMNIPGLRWTMEDVDEDGAYEYILEGFFQEYNMLEPSVLVVDGMHMGMFTSLGAAGMGGLTRSADGSRYFVRYGYYSAMNQAEMIFAWNGGRWSTILRWENEVVESGGEFTNQSTCFIGTDPVQEEEYYSALEQLELEDSFELANANPLEHTVPGDAQENFKVLDSYYENRKGCQQILSQDLDGDGDTDRVYAILGAADMWKENAAMEECHGAEIPFLFRDMALTLVVAENLGDSVRLRVCRLPGDGDFSPVTIVEGHLMYKDESYQYQAADTPFLAAGGQNAGSGISLTQMAGMAYRELKMLKWDSFRAEQVPAYPDEWVAYASIGSCNYAFRFIYTTMEDPNDMPYYLSVRYQGSGQSGAEVDDGVKLGMTYSQARAAADVGELMEAQMGAVAEFYPGGYNVVLLFDAKGDDAVLTGAEIYIID